VDNSTNSVILTNFGFDVLVVKEIGSNGDHNP
jgi:hypothetical protein